MPDDCVLDSAIALKTLITQSYTISPV
ncbi:uncharacterized protein FRV6_02387 [Fusarium oxysporum]|uniref:Uncharacterized protein n=1 Tax=Fusarium oxysporum TaxID=5507 RepID=A0A2H3T0E5_FUSOX|nr:uncharacterized protein FRV6_02387 [Fusarium oxysporum]